MRTRGYRDSGADEERLLSRIYGAGGPPPQPGMDTALGNEPDVLERDPDYSPDDNPYIGKYVIWVGYPGCTICQMNAAAEPRLYGTPFPSGAISPPAHKKCHCNLEVVDGPHPRPSIRRPHKIATPITPQWPDQSQWPDQ